MTFWKDLLHRPAGVALLCTLLFSLPFSATEIKKVLHSDAADFVVYLNAAYLVRAHDSADIYDSADTGLNPQLRRAARDSAFYRMAKAHGVDDIGVYVYPPFLADALLPLSPLSEHAALEVWRCVNFAALVATAWFLVWLFEWPLLSLPSALTLGAVLLFRTNLSAIYWEQVTLLLLLLTTAGITFYVKGWVRASAIVIALAAVIKLTPGILVLPFLFWREWRWLRWFAGVFVLCILLSCVLNGPAVTADFFFHVMLPMSTGTPGVLDCSLPSGIQMFGAALSGAQVKDTLFIPVRHSIVLLSELMATVIFLAGCGLLYRRGRPQDPMERATLLALVILFGVADAPVSWRHAYAVAVPLLFLLWRKALHGEYSRGWLLYLCFATIEFGFIVDSMLGKVSHGTVYGMIPLISPICFLVLIFHEFIGGRSEGRETSTPPVRLAGRQRAEKAAFFARARL